MSKKILSLMLVFVSLFIQAQEITMSSEPQMADAFRKEGKIYVVITVIALVFLALAGFLVYIERKLKKIEDKINNPLKD